MLPLSFCRPPGSEKISELGGTIYFEGPGTESDKTKPNNIALLFLLSPQSVAFFSFCKTQHEYIQPGLKGDPSVTTCLTGLCRNLAISEPEGWALECLTRLWKALNYNRVQQRLDQNARGRCV